MGMISGCAPPLQEMRLRPLCIEEEPTLVKDKIREIAAYIEHNRPFYLREKRGMVYLRQRCGMFWIASDLFNRQPSRENHEL
jgi:hypothetical protein